MTVKHFNSVVARKNENADDIRNARELRNKLHTEVAKNIKELPDDEDREEVVIKPDIRIGVALEYLADTTSFNGAHAVSEVYQVFMDLGFDHIGEASDAIREGQMPKFMPGKLANTVDPETEIVACLALRDAAQIVYTQKQHAK